MINTIKILIFLLVSIFSLWIYFNSHADNNNLIKPKVNQTTRIALDSIVENIKSKEYTMSRIGYTSNLSIIKK